MAARVLLMCSFMLLEVGLLASAIVGVANQRRYRYEMDSEGIASCVMLSVAIPIAWLLTIAFFLRKSSHAKARQVVTDAHVEAARILAEASDKAMALCSLDGGRCNQCGNPRTGKFCPKCGASGTGTSAAAAAAA